MTESLQPTAIPRSHSRFIRHPGAAPRIEILESRDTRSAPVVIVRCGPCNQRLYDLAAGQSFHGDYDRMVEDGALVVTRKYPNCRGLSAGRVTAVVGQPIE